MSKKQDRSRLCSFTFADGRCCKLPKSPDDPALCTFHAKKFRERITAEEAGRKISAYLDSDILTACDLSSAFAALFSATAQGHIKPKTATSLAYLGQLMFQTQRLAKEEFLQAFTTPWREAVQMSLCFNQPEPPPATPQSNPSTPTSNSPGLADATPASRKIM